jgi:hypothetical protein
MLHEIPNVRQILDEGRRRWFTDAYFDLIVWYAEGGSLVGFQLCYDKQGGERAFTWRRGHPCVHEGMDDGESPGHSKMSPVLSEGSPAPSPNIPERFLRESAEVDPAIVRMVYTTIFTYPARAQEILPVA